jgi:hypothetical protein
MAISNAVNAAAQLLPEHGDAAICGTQMLQGADGYRALPP